MEAAGPSGGAFVVLGLCGFVVVGAAVLAVILALMWSRKSPNAGPGEVAYLRAEVEHLRDEVERLRKDLDALRPVLASANTAIQ